MYFIVRFHTRSGSGTHPASARWKWSKTRWDQWTEYSRNTGAIYNASGSSRFAARTASAFDRSKLCTSTGTACSTSGCTGLPTGTLFRSQAVSVWGLFSCRLLRERQAKIRKLTASKYVLLLASLSTLRKMKIYLDFTYRDHKAKQFCNFASGERLSVYWAWFWNPFVLT